MEDTQWHHDERRLSRHATFYHGPRAGFIWCYTEIFEYLPLKV